MDQSKQFQENDINPYLWCGVGALVGWLASRFVGSGELVVTIETMCVGNFGAFLGGDFVVAMFKGGVVDDKTLHASSPGSAFGLMACRRKIVGTVARRGTYWRI